MPAVVSMQVYDQKVRFVSRSVSRVQHLCSPAVGLRLSLDSTRARLALRWSSAKLSSSRLAECDQVPFGE